MLLSVPNILTLLNLFAGCCALVFVFADRAIEAIICLIISLVCDFLDGMAARLIGRVQPLGRELDSLADVVSFGAVPGAMLYQMLTDLDLAAPWLPFTGFLVTVFGAYRLAKFNLDTRQTHFFLGLPIPSSAIYVAGLYWISQIGSCQDCSQIFINPWFLIGSILFLSFLMISSVPHFSFKFKSWRWKGNEIRWIYLIVVLPLIWLLRELSITMSIVLYVLLSLVYYSLFNKPD